MTRFSAGFLALYFGIACIANAKAAQSPAPTSMSSTATSAHNDYSRPAAWLCLPGREDACEADLSTTIIAPDGKVTREGFTPNPKAPIDCFYVYPTVSDETTPNADMTPGAGERAVARQQIARFTSQCKVYAPLYRQTTLAVLRAVIEGKQVHADSALPYNDVLDAWNYYLAHYNKGRGVVLVGHSQGSGVLAHLVKNEIDGKPVQSRLVAAIVPGTTIAVPDGKDVGGTFDHTPLCHSAKQTGCVIVYSSYRADSPPPADSHFGRVKDAGMMAACVNPASLGGGSGELHSYLSTGPNGFNSSVALPKPWVTPEKKIDTPFVSVPGLLTARCVDNEGASYLAIEIHGDPNDKRTGDIVGDLIHNGTVVKSFGLHLIDVNLALGNLVHIVGEQSKAWLAENHQASVQ